MYREFSVLFKRNGIYQTEQFNLKPSKSTFYQKYKDLCSEDRKNVDGFFRLRDRSIELDGDLPKFYDDIDREQIFLELMIKKYLENKNSRSNFQN